MVKPGYKKTEVGVILDDWEVFKFGTRVQIFRGGSPRPIQNFLTQSEEGINWIKIGDVREGDKYISSTQEKIIPQGISRSREVHVGDFILSNSMSFGRPYILNINGCIHDGWLTIQNYQSTFNKEYLYYLLSSNFVFQQYISMAAGSSVQNLNKEKVAKLITICPVLKEQQKIAEVLSDMDEMIASLEKLISKKKAIKQGVMQELLTGKKRLPGFSGQWEEIKIGSRGGLTKASINPQDHPNEIFTEYSMPAFDDGRSPVVTNGGTMHSNRTLIDGEVLLFNKLNVRQRRIWHIPKCEPNAVCSSEFLAYKSTEFDLQLLSQILNTDKVTDEFIGMSTGTSNSQRRITPANFMDYVVKIPIDRVEQQAIASVLSDMDAEIEALEQKLAKCRQTKQGMMQQLLTGKIRLV